MRVPFIGGSNTSRTVNVAAQRTVNMYAELDPESKYQAGLFARPGLVTYSTGPSDGVRGSAVFGDNLYYVVGTEVIKVTTAAAVSTIGTIYTSSGRVSFATNKTQLMFVDGTYGYTTTGSSVTQISDGDFPNGATVVVFLDGYFIVNDPGNIGRFHVSDLDDGTAWTATFFGTAARNPDALISLAVPDRTLWLIGALTTEVWWNSGNPDFPFESTESGFVEWGTLSAHSVVVVVSPTGGTAVISLAENKDGGRVVMSSGGRVSTHALESTINGYTTVSDAYAWSLVWEGHTFYVLTFPTESATWVLDLATGLWAEWKSYGISRFRGSSHTYFDEKHIIGDYQDGTLFQLSATQYSDAGGFLERIREDRHIASERRWLFHRVFELEVESGTGTAELDPQVSLQWSDDGGHTWSNEHWRGLGKVGEYKTLVRWRQLGRSRDRIYRTTFTDDAKFTIVSGHVTMDLGGG